MEGKISDHSGHCGLLAGLYLIETNLYANSFPEYLTRPSEIKGCVSVPGENCAPLDVWRDVERWSIGREFMSFFSF